MKVKVERVLRQDKTKKGTPIYTLLINTGFEGDQGDVVTVVSNNGFIKQDSIINLNPTKRDVLYFASPDSTTKAF